MDFLFLIFLFRGIIGIKPYAMLGMAAVQDHNFLVRRRYKNNVWTFSKNALN